MDDDFSYLKEYGLSFDDSEDEEIDSSIFNEIKKTDDREWFNKLLNSVKLDKKTDLYKFKLTNITFDKLYDISELLFSNINKPKELKMIKKTKNRVPIFDLFDELHLDSNFIQYITCHKGDDKLYTISIKNLNFKQACKIRDSLN